MTHLHHVEGPAAPGSAWPSCRGCWRRWPAWPANRPDRRIDYIWLSPDLAATGFAATTSTASDHRGVAVTVRQRRGVGLRPTINGLRPASSPVG
jgi:endonuclease/exonuclease/phosphatase family metal-dependent hydrolase